MSEISVYDAVPTPKLADKLIGTSVGGVIEDVTYNFTLQQLLQLFIPNLPANNLQGVLNYGNTATQNINLTGTINTTNLNVLATANILNSNLSGNTRVMAGLFDRTNSSGTAGQVLRSTGTQVEWYTVPTVIPTLQQVLQSGNTSDVSIVLTANITAATATAANVVSNTSLNVNGVLRDGTAAVGAANQILSSTGSGVRWVDLPAYNVVSPLLYNNVTKTFSIQVANASQNGYLSSADWINFDGKQDAIVLTTTGTSGAATFVGNTLNIPVYSPDLSGYVPTSRTLTINGVTYDLSANRTWSLPVGVASVTATAPLYSSGGANPNITITQSSDTADGYLSSADWIAFNNKQAALSGTGLVKSTAGVISYITDNSTNWNTAYNDSIVSAAVTGTSTKTLTLNQQDGGTIQASWSDADTGLTSVGLSMPSAFTVTNSPLTSNGTIGVTGAGTTAQYVRGDGSLATFPTIASEAQRLVTEVYNNSGATLTKGTVVYVNGGQGNLPTITKAIATGDSTSAQTYGVVQNDITNMNNGYVVVIGSLQNLDTQAYTNGTQLYLSSTVAGAWTSVKQYAPAHLVYVGIVIRSHPTQGVVEIRIQNGFEMDELHNVFAQNPNNNAILQYKTATSLWTSVDGTTTNIAEGTNLYYLDSRARAALSFTAGSGAYNSTTGVITIPTNTNQLTNGASFITLTSLIAASPLSYDNSIGAFSISQAGASADGYLSSTDWNTFNNKQGAGDYITSLTGEATGTGPGATAVTLDNASVTGKVLTGVNITGGTVLATDTMLTAFGKLQNQINGLIGSTIYQGTWNAATNTPALASGVGTRGYYYIVNVAGNTNLNGITDWQVGDWAIYDGSAWQKVDNTDSVTSVNGFTGAVSLTTDNIAQGTTNLYFANSLARSAVSLTTTGSSGAATYNNTTGVFNIPNYGTALANYLPLTGGTLTGALLINPSDTAVVGLNVASDTVILRSDSTQPFRRQLTTTMGSGTLIKMQASGSGAVYVTDLGFYTSSSSALNATPNLYLTGGNNRVGINTDVPAHTLDVVGTAGVSGVLTLGSTISNGTFTYTLPGATGTLALVGGAGVGTVTSVAALTIGTTGTDLSSSVANSTTTPVITLNVPTASATNRGALSAADWTTFNSKQNALTNPITGTLTTGYIPKATGVTTLGNSIIFENATGIGIGTNGPLARLHVDSTAALTAIFDCSSNNTYISWQNDTVAFGDIGSAASLATGGAVNDFAIRARDTANIIFSTNATEKMRLTNAGRLGIGTTIVPTGRLLGVSGGAQFNGAALMEGANFSIIPAANGQDGVTLNVGYDTGTDYGSLFINTGGNTSMTLTKNGNVTFAGSATATSIIKVGGTSSQFLMADGSVSTGPSGGITGSLTTNFIPRATGTTTLGNSSLQTDASGNLGLGVAPAAWSGFRAMNILGGSISTNSSGGGVVIARNWYFDGNERYNGDGLAQRIELVSNRFVFQLAPNNTSGAGAALTWSTPMTLTPTENLLLGTITDSGFKLDVNGTGRFSSFLNANAQTTAANGSVNIESLDPALRFRVTSGTANNRIYEWRAVAAGGVNNIMQLRLWNDAQTSASTLFSVSSAGAGTFASSVTASGVIFNTNDSVFSTPGSITKHSTVGLVLRGVTADVFDFAIYSAGGTVLMNNPVGTNNIGFGGPATFSSSVTASGAISTSGTGLNASVRIANTTATTGRDWHLYSLNNGSFGLYNNTDSLYSFYSFANGNIGINTTTDAGFKLDVNGTGRFQGSATINGANSCLAVTDGTNTSFIGLASVGGAYGNGTIAGDIVVRGTNGISLVPAAGAFTALRIASTGAATFSGQVSTGALYPSYLSFYNAAAANKFIKLADDASEINAIGFSKSGSTATVWFPNGNVGIGNTGNASRRLEVSQPSGYSAGIRIIADSGGDAKIQFLASGGSSQPDIGPTAASPNDLIFGAGGVERMRLTSSGTLAFNGSNGPNSGGLDKFSLGFQDGVDGWLQTWGGRPLSLNSQGNPVLIGTRTSNGAVFQVVGTATISGQFVQGGGAARSTLGTTIAFSGGSQTVWTANSDSGDGGRFFSIVNESSTTNAFSAVSFRVNPNGASNAMMDMKFVNNTGGASTLYWTFLSNGSWFDRMTLSSTGNLTAAAFFESSDARIKTLITDNYQAKGIESVVAKLYTKNGKEELGYYAQDVQGILPSAVSKGSDGLLSLSYREVHTAKIARLEKRVAELEEKLNLN